MASFITSSPGALDELKALPLKEALNGLPENGVIGKEDAGIVEPLALHETSTEGRWSTSVSTSLNATSTDAENDNAAQIDGAVVPVAETSEESKDEGGDGYTPSAAQEPVATAANDIVSAPTDAIEVTLGAETAHPIDEPQPADAQDGHVPALQPEPDILPESAEEPHSVDEAPSPTDAIALDIEPISGSIPLAKSGVQEGAAVASADTGVSAIDDSEVVLCDTMDEAIVVDEPIVSLPSQPEETVVVKAEEVLTAPVIEAETVEEPVTVVEPVDEATPVAEETLIAAIEEAPSESELAAAEEVVVSEEPVVVAEVKIVESIVPRTIEVEETLELEADEPVPATDAGEADYTTTELVKDEPSESIFCRRSPPAEVDDASPPVTEEAILAEEPTVIAEVEIAEPVTQVSEVEQVVELEVPEEEAEPETEVLPAAVEPSHVYSVEAEEPAAEVEATP
ncbi:hypothetical protein BU15DRAFT_76696 [Melanogaster broomeanus]|nr:hypothetical protein BU15DRAFT_76696 [Melanogaster broomeanus]